MASRAEGGDDARRLAATATTLTAENLSIMLFLQFGPGELGAAVYQRAPPLQGQLTKALFNERSHGATRWWSEVERDPNDRPLLDDVEDESIVAIVNAKCPISGDRGDGFVELVPEPNADIPIDVSATTAD